MNKKGFTLIELLAVIVILAIIALIAVPAVLNIIEDSRISATKESARNIARAAETYYMQGVMKGNTPDSIDLTGNILNYNGEKPEKGMLTYDETGRAYIKMYMNGYCVLVDYDNTVSSEKMDKSECKLNTVILSIDAKGGEVSEVSREYGSGDELGELPNATKEGYTFNGWTLVDGTMVTSTTKITENMTINASYTAKTYTVTLNDGDNNTTDSTMIVTYDSPYGEINAPTRNGYNFLGWKLSDGTDITNESIVKLAENHTLYAQWENGILVFNDGAPVYFNPTTGEKCSASLAIVNENNYKAANGDTLDGLTSGCMKFYAFLDSEENENVNLLLGHNVASNLLGSMLRNPILDELQVYTNSWVQKIDDTQVSLSSRLLSFDEILQIAPLKEGTTLSKESATDYYYFHTGTKEYYNGEAGTNKYAWLFDNTGGCLASGCYNEDINYDNIGYYTIDTASSTNERWTVSSNGSLSTIPVSIQFAEGPGFRPVIEVSKDVLR